MGQSKVAGVRNDLFLASVMQEVERASLEGVTSPLASLEAFEYNQFDDEFSVEELSAFLNAYSSLTRLKRKVTPTESATQSGRSDAFVRFKPK